MVNIVRLSRSACGKSQHKPLRRLKSDSGSALFNLYEVSISHYHDDDVRKMRVLDSLESTAVSLVDFSKHVFADPTRKDASFMSPFIPLSLYQSAVIQHRAWRRTKVPFCKERVATLVNTLQLFSKRWFAAGERKSSGRRKLLSIVFEGRIAADQIYREIPAKFE
jgi:hypothetical protein